MRGHFYIKYQRHFHLKGSTRTPVDHRSKKSRGSFAGYTQRIHREKGIIMYLIRKSRSGRSGGAPFFCWYGHENLYFHPVRPF